MPYPIKTYKTSPKVRPSRGPLGVTAKETAARVSRSSGAFRGFQGNAVGTGATQSTMRVSSKSRLNPALRIVHQVEEILLHIVIPPGLDCSLLSVQMDQEADGPVYSLKTVMARPSFIEIEVSALSLVRSSNPTFITHMMT